MLQLIKRVSGRISNDFRTRSIVRGSKLCLSIWFGYVKGDGYEKFILVDKRKSE
jgi:hypothetical protein